MKINEQLTVQLGVALLAFVVSARALRVEPSGGRRRQVGGSRAALAAPEDHEAEATGFLGAAAVQGHSKYFQYAHVPHKDHYEAGHKRGNDHHFIERHEKAHPHAGEFKTKVRWGDKKGGYGEHYWDYNHAGHGDNNDEGSEAIADYQESEESAPRTRRHQSPLPRDLVLDAATGRVTDQSNGRQFFLQPIE